MLSDLKFIQGGVSKKDLVPAMSHVVIANGFARSYNGVLALGSPLACDLDCMPRADTLLRAVSMCTDTIQLSMTEAGRLRVQSGAFRVFVDCLTEQEVPHVYPEGAAYNIDGARMLHALEALLPYVSDDASRPWSRGVLLAGQSAFATNNIILSEYWLGGTLFPHAPQTALNIPKIAVQEIVRIGEAPIGIQLDAQSATLHYTGNRWLRTQLLQTDWPDVYKALQQQAAQCLAIPPLFYDALEYLRPFADKLGRVYFCEDGRMSTTPGSEGEGASFAVPGLPSNGLFNVEMLLALRGIATHVDFSNYPAPCPFFGVNDAMRGVIIGMRK